MNDRWTMPTGPTYEEKRHEPLSNEAVWALVEAIEEARRSGAPGVLVDFAPAAVYIKPLTNQRARKVDLRAA